MKDDHKYLTKLIYYCSYGYYMRTKILNFQNSLTTINWLSNIINILHIQIQNNNSVYTNTKV